MSVESPPFHGFREVFEDHFDLFRKFAEQGFGFT